MTRQTTIRPRLFAITSIEGYGLSATRAMVERVVHAPRGTVAVVLRERALGAAAYLALAREYRALTRAHEQWLFVVDRFDLCQLSEADGLHMGGRALSPEALRPRLPDAAPALSTGWHLGELMPAAADALWLSPVAAARKGRQVLPTVKLHGALAAAQASGALPVALGGVDALTVPELAAAGFESFAAIGALYREPLQVMAALGLL